MRQNVNHFSASVVWPLHTCDPGLPFHFWSVDTRTTLLMWCLSVVRSCPEIGTVSSRSVGCWRLCDDTLERISCPAFTCLELFECPRPGQEHDRTGGRLDRLRLRGILDRVHFHHLVVLRLPSLDGFHPPGGSRCGGDRDRETGLAPFDLAAADCVSACPVETLLCRPLTVRDALRPQ